MGAFCERSNPMEFTPRIYPRRIGAFKPDTGFSRPEWMMPTRVRRRPLVLRVLRYTPSRS